MRRPQTGRRWGVLAAIGLIAGLLGACSDVAADEATTTAAEPATTTTEATTTTTVAPTTTTTTEAEVHHQGVADARDVVAATLATAAFQDVAMAEAAGYGSTMNALGCFESAESGGMGLHYLNESLMDDTVDVAAPEALVYELGADGNIVGLVAHEYIVPLEARTSSEPPRLFGLDFHQHSTLPLWILHAWLWKDNPAGMFQDYNPAVRLCPEGVPIFGVDLP